MKTALLLLALAVFIPCQSQCDEPIKIHESEIISGDIEPNTLYCFCDTTGIEIGAGTILKIISPVNNGWWTVIVNGEVYNRDSDFYSATIKIDTVLLFFDFDDPICITTPNDKLKYHFVKFKE